MMPREPRLRLEIAKVSLVKLEQRRAALLA
jgi:hypothetical protein